MKLYEEKEGGIYKYIVSTVLHERKIILHFNVCSECKKRIDEDHDIELTLLLKKYIDEKSEQVYLFVIEQKNKERDEQEKINKDRKEIIDIITKVCDRVRDELQEEYKCK